MFKFLIIFILFSNDVFSQTFDKNYIDRYVEEIEKNTNLEISIHEGYIKKKFKKYGYSYNIFKINGKIVFIKEYLSDKKYTTNSYYFIDNILVYYKSNIELHRKNYIENIKECNIYFEGINLNSCEIEPAYIKNRVEILFKE